LLRRPYGLRDKLKNTGRIDRNEGFERLNQMMSDGRNDGVRKAV
jgi:hypothetical protein